jgi:hypothetical protein
LPFLKNSIAIFILIMRVKFAYVLLGLTIIANHSFSQQSVSSNQFIGGDVNTITTAVPFLTIAPDARGGAIGDAGVATSPDASSMHWNPSKLAFIESDMGASVSFSPWLRNLVNDIYLAHLSGYKRLNKRSTVGVSLLYFSLGDITFTNENAQNIGQFKPNEFAISGAYATQLSDRFSGGVSLRYINSNLTNGINDTKAGNAFSVDLSGFYLNDDAELFDRDAEIGFGFNISNIGTKMSYSESARKDFIPINLRLGQSTKLKLDDYNSITLITDVNKLLVPTPPRYAIDANGEIIRDADKNPVIADGKDPNVGVASAIFGSFSDAPDGFKEELREFSYSVGMEYWYDNQFAVRFGHFNEHKTKGNRKYYTVGIGLKLNVFGLDLAYLIASQQRSPLANTVRATLTFDFEAFGKQNDEAPATN